MKVDDSTSTVDVDEVALKVEVAVKPQLAETTQAKGLLKANIFTVDQYFSKTSNPAKMKLRVNVWIWRISKSVVDNRFTPLF